MVNDSVRFPIGEYEKPIKITTDILKENIQHIASFPQRLRKEVAHLTDEQLDTQYRPEGWTIRQVIHHCADSHMNSLMRFKLALTESEPSIKPYHEALWADLVDSRQMDIAPSLQILEGVHLRWIAILQALTPAQLKLTFVHPEHGKVFQLDENIGIYAWHCNHHLAHITMLKKTKKWA